MKETASRQRQHRWLSLDEGDCLFTKETASIKHTAFSWRELPLDETESLLMRMTAWWSKLHDGGCLLIKKTTGDCLKEMASWWRRLKDYASWWRWLPPDEGHCLSPDVRGCLLQRGLSLGAGDRLLMRQTASCEGCCLFMEETASYKGCCLLMKETASWWGDCLL